MKNLLRLSGAVALCSIPAMSFYHMHTPGQAKIEVDMSSTGSNYNWNTWTTPGGSTGTKYFQMDLGPKVGGGGQCYDIYIDGDTMDDVRLWTFGNVSIDDDGPGHRRPTARFWITSIFNLRVSAFSSAYNTIGFYVFSSMITASTAAACDDGAKPFYNQATGVLLRANTTAN